jgi:hypothetical protein
MYCIRSQHFDTFATTAACLLGWPASRCDNIATFNNGDSPWKPVPVACFQSKFTWQAPSANSPVHVRAESAHYPFQPV